MESSSQTAFCHGLLKQADLALEQGKAQHSAVLAGQVQVQAIGMRDLHLRAQAELIIARVDTLCSRFVDARRRSLFAVDQFQRREDPDRLPLALDVRNYSTSCLGNTQQALTWAQESFSLREADDDPQVTFTGLTYIGVMHAFDGQYLQADEMLASAGWFARETRTPGVHLHALLNQGLALMMSLVAGGPPVTSNPDLERLEQLLSQAHRVNSNGTSVQIPLQAGNACMTQVVLQFLTAGVLALSKQSDRATLHLVNCNMWLRALPRTSWLHTLPWWGQALWAWQKGDLARAVLCAGEMEMAARVGQNVPMQRLASGFRQQLRQQAAGAL